MKYGIEAASIYVPHIYLPIKDLAIQRNIDPDKLEIGLGLKKMSVLDVHEDTATIAANALLKLITDFDINPTEIGRIYLGTESALDGAKPTATYAVQLVESVLAKQFGERPFRHTDVVDMTFACVGGVDAMHNSIDYVRVNPAKKAIVIAADYAKYGLESTGEYTQGAGAVAMLISNQPDLIAFDNNWGIGMESVFDFFKPHQSTSDEAILNALGTTKSEIEIFSDEPVFEGQYSNECYKNRVREAYFNFKDEAKIEGKLYESWRYIAFHLPYAFQGKRMFSDVFALENDQDNSNDNLKVVSKSDEYKALIKEKVEPTQRASSEIGNMYTASVFTAFLSALQVSADSNEELNGKTVGFIAYGSGSKSKVFQGQIGEGWKNVMNKMDLFTYLNKREAISFEQYQDLHNKNLKTSINDSKGFALDRIETEIPDLKGARYYTFKG
ncbi:MULTISPECIES: hydroxymethylglutaryl-CoA synthase family protein [Empedobacter]|uniref:Hydroxymethylglutaryl-CoA synthase family protein n=1 Tax=Empedobacter falsenii TaxID=343874 RepID=A0A376G127_9FLAO|nr:MULTISPECIES: hydroxymethylglutaryl-CoA synthase [Empedobacter]MDH1601232.1 hydroxymethylglutaryl-CoA synthase family protein [Empedobacter sp. GD03739]MDM1041028.1 hydroxymethylglutaryl-CoA synthase family protein [Empedobacter brevis]MDM1134609.1 hydroxymethylglutaryl-CoA synthase family protein [Empedobacter sp. R750]RRT93480.1 hydroxymethylglutaryl-CoA synthase family protein [Empedobacter falsenii]RRT93626.1 hydroxymethylglutaryl-CoA synthase family protein [Empedobacter falsenii]